MPWRARTPRVRTSGCASATRAEQLARALYSAQTGSCVVDARGEAIAGASDGDAPLRREMPEIGTVLVGKPDGYMDLAIILDDGELDVSRHVVEFKVRETKLSQHPEHSDQIQILAYLALTGLQRGVVVQMLRRAPHTLTDHAVSIAGHAGWTDTVLPKLRRFCDLIRDLRRHPADRRDFISAKLEQQIERIQADCCAVSWVDVTRARENLPPPTPQAVKFRT